MAHPAFSQYINSTISGSVGYTSAYISSRLGTFQNPSWSPNLVDLSTGAMTNGITYGGLSPLWGSNYAKLLPGVHDGPITAFCFEAMPYFVKSVAQCKVRDDQTKNTGTENCINPDTSAGESSLSQCVNTVQNDTVRSGKAIVSTIPPTGTDANEAWTNQLVKNFMVNLSTGSSGQGSERGLSSVLQLLKDNETTETAFFRKGSLRGIIFVSDEEDQSMAIPENPPASYKPESDYLCDQASLITMNGAAAVTGNNGYCCTDPSMNCRYGSVGTSCPSKTVDGFTYTISVCPNPDKLISVSEVKTALDNFFQTLDETSSNPNYFVASIIPTSAAGMQQLQTDRNASDTTVGTIKTVAVDRGDRYIELGKLVGADSLALDISSSDYSPILDAIGKQIVEKKSTFTLSREPTSTEDMMIKIRHKDGAETVVSTDLYIIKGKSIVFTDQEFVLSFAATDQILINYQPKAVKNNLSHVLPILISAAIGLAIMIERAVALFNRYPIQNAEQFFDKVSQLVMAGKIQDAVQHCDQLTGKPMAKVVKSGLLRAHLPETVIEDGLHIAVSDATQAIQKRTSFLATIANVATLLGLFGTIAGLIHSFEAVGHADAQQKSALLSAGIATAMNATMLGLAVAIPCMVAFSFLINRSNRMISDIENASVKTLDILKQRFYASEHLEEAAAESKRSA
jgi:biopolymer transport protein ExbB/TolQ